MRYRQVSYRYASRAAAAFRPFAWSIHFEADQEGWQPPADVYETAEAIIARIEIAGVSDENLVLSAYEDALLIEGVRPWSPPPGAVRFDRADIRYGRFRLELPLPPDLDREHIGVTYDRGILTVSLPRSGRRQHERHV